MPVRVAAIQFRPDFGQKSSNLRRLATLVFQAVKGGARLVVLPELAACGYSFMSKTAAAAVAEDIRDGESVRLMTKLAKQLDVVIAWGLVERDSGTGDLHNSQALVTPGGKLISYRKVNPWGQDYIWATPGISNPPVMKLQLKTETGETETRKVGLLICRDVRDKANDDWNAFYEKGDADIVCFSSNWGKGGFPAGSWMDFVEDNACALIVANRYGTELNNDFGLGGVCVVSADGTVHCEDLVWGEDCVVYGDV